MICPCLFLISTVSHAQSMWQTCRLYDGICTWSFWLNLSCFLQLLQHFIWKLSAATTLQRFGEVQTWPFQSCPDLMTSVGKLQMAIMRLLLRICHQLLELLPSWVCVAAKRDAPRCVVNAERMKWHAQRCVSAINARIGNTSWMNCRFQMMILMLMNRMSFCITHFVFILKLQYLCKNYSASEELSNGMQHDYVLWKKLFPHITSQIWSVKYPSSIKKIRIRVNSNPQGSVPRKKSYCYL